MEIVMSKYKSLLMDREQELDCKINLFTKRKDKVAKLFKTLPPSVWSHNFWMEVGIKLEKEIKLMKLEKTNISY